MNNLLIELKRRQLQDEFNELRERMNNSQQDKNFHFQKGKNSACMSTSSLADTNIQLQNIEKLNFIGGTNGKRKN